MPNLLMSACFEENPVAVSVSTGHPHLAPGFAGNVSVLVDSHNGANLPVDGAVNNQEKTTNKCQMTENLFQACKKSNPCLL